MVGWFISALLAAFFWGIAPIFGKLGLTKADPLTALTVRTLGVAAALVAINAFGQKAGALRGLPPKAWIFLLLEGMCGSLLGHYAYLYALKHGAASATVPVTASFPIVTMIAAAILLGERLTIGKAIGGALVVLGVLLIRTL